MFLNIYITLSWYIKVIHYKLLLLYDAVRSHQVKCLYWYASTPTASGSVRPHLSSVCLSVLGVTQTHTRDLTVRPHSNNIMFHFDCHFVTRFVSLSYKLSLIRLYNFVRKHIFRPLLHSCRFVVPQGWHGTVYWCRQCTDRLDYLLILVEHRIC